MKNGRPRERYREGMEECKKKGFAAPGEKKSAASFALSRGTRQIFFREFQFSGLGGEVRKLGEMPLRLCRESGNNPSRGARRVTIFRTA